MTPRPESQRTECVDIFDTTLRDGEQSPGIALSVEQKVDIAHQLDRLGVDVIEAGFPISSPGNFAAVQAIARQVERPVIAALARAETADIDSAARALQDATRARIHTFISTSDIHIEHQMRSTRKDVKGLARAAVAHAKTYYDDIEFSPMDATRADEEFTAEVLQIAIDEGATVINIPDTVGYATPEIYTALISRMYEFVPALGGVVLSVHCHDDLGLAVANSFAGIQSGARQVECAINGLGERAGNTSLEEIVMLMRIHNGMYAYDTKINARELGPTSRMVSRHTGYLVQRNKAVIGDNAFKHESGIHQGGVLNNRKTFEIMDPAEVGMDTGGIVLGKQSGSSAIVAVLTKEGVYKAAYLKPTFELFKNITDKIGGISYAQMVAIHEEAQRRHSASYRLGGFDYEKQGEAYSAQVTLTTRDGTEKAGSASNDGNNPDIDGPVSALFNAIRAASSTNYQLENYNVRSIGQGEQTTGEVVVTLQLDSHVVIGKGLSTDTLEAAGWAYLDALSKASSDRVLKLQ